MELSDPSAKRVKISVEKQTRKKLMSYKYIYDGVEYESVAALARAVDIPYHRLYYRLESGWPLKDAVEMEAFNASQSGRMGAQVSGWDRRAMLPKRRKS